MCELKTLRANLVIDVASDATSKMLPTKCRLRHHDIETISKPASHDQRLSSHAFMLQCAAMDEPFIHLLL